MHVLCTFVPPFYAHKHEQTRKFPIGFYLPIPGDPRGGHTIEPTGGHGASGMLPPPRQGRSTARILTQMNLPSGQDSPENSSKQVVDTNVRVRIEVRFSFRVRVRPKVGVGVGVGVRIKVNLNLNPHPNLSFDLLIFPHVFLSPCRSSALAGCICLSQELAGRSLAG